MPVRIYIYHIRWILSSADWLELSNFVHGCPTEASLLRGCFCLLDFLHIVSKSQVNYLSPPVYSNFISTFPVSIFLSWKFLQSFMLYAFHFCILQMWLHYLEQDYISGNNFVHVDCSIHVLPYSCLSAISYFQFYLVMVRPDN